VCRPSINTNIDFGWRGLSATINATILLLMYFRQSNSDRLEYLRFRVAGTFRVTNDPIRVTMHFGQGSRLRSNMPHRSNQHNVVICNRDEVCLETQIMILNVQTSADH
jgi:hypothetical protein